MLVRFLDLCPEGGALLDAACGTGKYWPILLARGFSVHGTDQSLQMLRQAQTKCPEVPVEHVGMQELSFVDTFDGIICIDAMEMVFPEDWPFDLRNFARALHEHGFLYFTVNMPIMAATTTIRPMSRCGSGSLKPRLPCSRSHKVMSIDIIWQARKREKVLADMVDDRNQATAKVRDRACYVSYSRILPFIWKSHQVVPVKL